MKPFDVLVAEGEAADVTGWGFDWLAGRATEERPPWGYARLLEERLAVVQSALDLDTGGGEVLAEATRFPPLMCASALPGVAFKSWKPPKTLRCLLPMPLSSSSPRGILCGRTGRKSTACFNRAAAISRNTSGRHRPLN
jgi:hypothetical protein